MATLKPLPKAILIGVVVAAIGYGIMQVLPDPKVTPLPTIPVVNVQPLPPQEPAAVTQVQEAPTPAAPEPKATVSNGGAGLDAVLKAGQK